MKREKKNNIQLIYRPLPLKYTSINQYRFACIYPYYCIVLIYFELFEIDFSFFFSKSTKSILFVLKVMIFFQRKLTKLEHVLLYVKCMMNSYEQCFSDDDIFLSRVFYALFYSHVRSSYELSFYVWDKTKRKIENKS